MNYFCVIFFISNNKPNFDMTRFNDSIWSLRDDEEDSYYVEEIIYSGQKYGYDYQWYYETFPEHWAMCHEEGTGPGQCGNCADYGSINGVFIGYCANCAEYVYNGSRGRGFIDVGVEYEGAEMLEYPSVFDTYLEGVDIWAIEGVSIPDPDSDNDSMPDLISDDDSLSESDNDSMPELIPIEFGEEDSDDKDINSIEYDGIYDEGTGVFHCHFEGGYNDF